MEKIAGGFAMIAKRDFYTFMIMVLVIIGLSIPAYFSMAGGALLVGVGGIIALMRRARRTSKKAKPETKKADKSKSEAKTEEKAEEQSEPKAEDQTEDAS